MHASYHNHSSFSDGKAAVDAVVEAAAAAGLDEVGLSDHLTLHPTRRVSWSMQPNELDAYARAVAAARARHADALPVRLGLELDWFAGREPMLAQAIASQPFDYVIGSVHFVGDFPIDGSPHRWANLSRDEVASIHREYWVQMRAMAASGLFDIAAHLDLPKKFGHTPDEQPSDLIDAALDALAQHNVAVELNTAGWHKVCAEPYPSLDILTRCRERGIDTLLSADAHDPAHLVRDFDRGALLLREAGYDTVVRFAERTRTRVPLSD